MDGSLRLGLSVVCLLALMIALRELYIEHARGEWLDDGNCNADGQILFDV